MSVNLYRLYAVQSFNGEKVAIYSSAGNYPEGEIISDSFDIVDGNKTFREVVEDRKYFYDEGKKRKLDYFTRLFKRSQKVLNDNEEVGKAIFVENTDPRNWRGERTLYENKVFDTIKADTPEYTGCTAVGTINI